MPDFTNDIENCLKALSNEGIILYPTDTIWGIGCDATEPAAVEKIFQLKKRAAEQSMIVLVADEKDILNYVANPDPEALEYLRNTTKPTTVVYEGAIGIAENLLGKDGSIAIRICKEDFCRQLIKRFRKPIVSTSANFSGENPPANFSEIEQKIKEGVDYIVQYRQDDLQPAIPSSVIKWQKGGPRILRS
ncbi:MAG TPA: L-threonylcarbamoyladenylate synthase [Chitinophagaceae bacterium]|nr:L-threonylcarbamoyladenylate synthase [Chitinophagaceae bacterium]